jgi:hypothetical protein
MRERKPSRLGEADFLLLTAPQVWTLGSSRDVVKVDFVRGSQARA